MSTTVIKPDFEAAQKHFIFTQEHEDLRESMEEWVKKELYPHRMEWEETKWPNWAMERAGELGYLGLCFPEEYGGQGGDYYYSLVRAEALSHAGSGGLGMGFAVQTDMVLPPIEMLGTEEQKERYLTPGIEGKRIGCLGITEPGAGSDVASIRTTAKLEGDEYVINGSKTFITNAARADFIVLVAKTDPEAGHNGISLLLIDIRDEDGNELPGFSVAQNLDKMGMEASDTCEIAFEDMRVPADSILGEVGKGFYHITWELQGERLVAAAGSNAGAERLLETAIEYAKERVQFGRPIGSFQAIQHKCADMVTDVDGCRFITYKAAWAIASDQPADETALAVHMAKAWTSEASRRVVAHGQQIHGGIGYTRDYKIQLFFRRQKRGELAFGDADFHRELVAQRIGL